MKKIILLGLFLSISVHAHLQCVASASVSETSVTCNECVTLTAFGNTGTSVFKENFDNGAPTGWAFTQAGDFSNPCLPGVNGTPYLWMGSSSVNPRDMETVSFDLALGGTICFDMLYAKQGNSDPCEGPDEPDEGVFLQYSIDGGATWVTIQYHDPLGGNNPTLTSWNNYCYPIPAAAMTASTKIRWHQDAVSGAEYDHWGIDNVEINLNDPSLSVTWLHDNYSYGNGNTGGVNPTQVCPAGDTSFIVEVTNGVLTCYDTIKVKAIVPIITLGFSPQDTAICEGDCFSVDYNYHVLIDSARVKKYENKQPEDIDETGGGIFSSVEVGLNVQGLNMQNVLPNSIKEVCITGLSAYRSNILWTLDVGTVDVELECPSGAIITLVPSGETSGGGGLGYNNGYLNTCFTPTGPSIASGTVPYTGSWASSDPFNDLAGCTSNGVWKLRMSESALFTNLKGKLDGFSITFCDDSISYPGLATWNHTTWMTNPNSNPVVCPLRDTSYVLTVTDSNNCVSKSDTLTVTISPVSDAGNDSAYATCSPAQIDLFDYLGGSPSNGGLWLDPTGAIVNMPIIPGVALTGNYEYVVTNIAGCNDTAIVNFTTGGTESLDLLGADVNICSGENLQLSVNVAGATYLWSTGATTNSINVNAAGTYWVNATTAAFGCVVTDTIIVTETVSPDAGDDGSIFICDSKPIDLFVELLGTPTPGGNWLDPSGNSISMPIPLVIGDYKYYVVNGSCSDTAIVTVSSGGVTADFTYNPLGIIYNNETEVVFQEASTNASFHEWHIDWVSQNFGFNFTTKFPGVGIYDVCLVSFNNNCRDTICKLIEVEDRIAVFLPNTFTPDEDGKNDYFGPSVIGEIKKYDFTIFNRWGEIIFQSSIVNEKWDGRVGSKDVKTGVYVWRLTYKTEEEGAVKRTGHVNVLR